MRYRPEWLSEGAEVLAARLERERSLVYDVVVVGSGYGGAVAASRFAGARTRDGKRLGVCVLERGNEYVVGSFPSRLAELPGYVRFSRYDDVKPKGRRDALFDLRIGADVTVVLASGLGGGSLINAAVAERAPDALRQPAWPDAIRRRRGALDKYYARAEKMLAVTPAVTDRLEKYRQFERFVAGLPASGMHVEAARPAKVAISFTDRKPNAQGVEQQACIRCGDCVTGCNFGAKNTLAMNYLPDARRKGAEIYTGATVLYLERIPGNGEARWSVAFRLTSDKEVPGKPATLHRVRARHVVLAAGTLGSPEILLRSRARGLRLSTRLGKQFSANGDMISALYAQREPVHASAAEQEPFAAREVGPTITGIARAQTEAWDPLTLEELAIPGALRRLFEEVTTTAAAPVQLSRFDWSTHHPGERDPAAVDAGAIDRTQVFAAFGDDGARGTLEMANGWESSAWDGAITVAWPGAGKEAVYRLQDRLLRCDTGSGGLYLRSPLWQPLPEALSSALSGAKPDGKLISVHPLGGCPMGSDRETGVVDDIGRVFDLRGETTTYEGLLVLDGSILPAALGINPLLTIAALAERSVARYAATQGWRPRRRADALPPGPPKFRETQLVEAKTRIRFAEKMKGPLKLADGFTRDVECELEIKFQPTPAIPRFLEDPAHRVETDRAWFRAGGASAAVRGEVRWLERGRTGWLGRIACALWTWVRARGLADLIERVRRDGWYGLWQMIREGGSLLKLASNAGEVRHLRYRLTLAEDLNNGKGVLLPAETVITGLKTFAYSFGGNPWRQLTELRVTATPPGGAEREVGTLRLDPLHLLRRYAVQLQAVERTDAPTMLVDIASIALHMARLAFKIHFWSFGLPEYQKYDPDRAQRRLPGDLAGLERSVYTVHVPVAPGKSRLALPLTCYRPEGKDPKTLTRPVVLFHGFGSSGAQFAFREPGRQRNLVRHLAERDFEVWVPELRTSIGVASSHDQWTLDEVAKNDIPAIVEFVLDKTQAQERRQVDVVAHCIGSAMFCTAVLAGELAEAPGVSKVRRAVLLQVGPLVTLSETNKFNARLITFLKRYAQVDHVDSSVDDRADWVDALVDRVLNTYPYPPEEAKHHRLWPPWIRRPHVANCNRSAAVFGRLFDHANVDEAMLDSLGDLIGHTNLRTFEQTLQYAFLERLTDQNAANAYVTTENVRNHFCFPVRFVHGERNAVFSPATSVRSCRLLNEVRPGIADLVRLKKYGHLDPLIGRSAHRDVFPKISNFLSPAVAPVRSRLNRALAKSSERFGRRPLVGPVLGWTRWDGERWVARVWCRADDTRVAPSFVMTIPYIDGRAAPAQHDLGALTPPPGARVPTVDCGARVDGIETLVAVDVALGPQPADVDILVASAYDKPGGTASGHAQLLEGERAKWHADVRSGEKPGLTAADPGYDERMDSVVVRKAVLEALDPARTSLTFAVASCRYSGSVVDREAADVMLGKLRALIERPNATDRPALLLLAGDQIYADATAGVFDPDTARERFYESYHETWTAPNARAVLRALPTYMMMDDHEVQDNWSRGQADAETERWGLAAFLRYQWLHSPRNAEELLGPGKHEERERYFYGFEAAGFEFFVCDTRTTRTPGVEIMDEEQLEAVQRWLEKDRTQERKQDRHKFIVSPSLVVPFKSETQGRSGPYRHAYLQRSDGWDAFPGCLRSLMLCIVRNGIRNVVFLCGDAHQSMASRIWFVGRSQGARQLGTACIVSSPLHAPYPFANSRREEFAEEGALELDDEWTMHYVLEGDPVERDGFAVVNADASAARPSLTVRFHLRDRDEPERRELPSVAAHARLPEHGFRASPEPPPVAIEPRARQGGEEQPSQPPTSRDADERTSQPPTSGPRR
jgi:choline dehydrogenase-like flavoprotein